MTDLSPDNKIINGLWISPDSKPLSNLERLCLYSYCAHGHDFRLWAYGDLPNVPQDTAPGKVEVCDGNKILSADKIFSYYDSYAGFCDWFRWELIRQVGGWYVDMDIACLRPFNLSDNIVLGKSSYQTFNSAIIKCPAHHSIPTAMAEACANPDRIMPWDNARRKSRKLRRRIQFWKNSYECIKWGESGGPDGLTFAMKHFGESVAPQPPWYFEPIPTGAFTEFFDESLHKREILDGILRHSYSIHFFHSGWKERGYDKNGKFHPNSPYEILKRRYLPEFKES